MAGYSFKLEGLEDVIKKLNPEKLEKKLGYVLKSFGEDVAREAKQNVPVNEGFLKNSINSKVDGLSVEVVVNADYAAYVKFGTRKFAQEYVARLPQEWQDFAAKYKGPGGGSFDEFVMRVFEWVRKKA